MSYRTFKRLLGETSLERKCRFLFGGGLLILIVGSFAFYGHRTANLLYEQHEITGEMLTQTIMTYEHPIWVKQKEAQEPQPAKEPQQAKETAPDEEALPSHVTHVVKVPEFSTDLTWAVRSPDPEDTDKRPKEYSGHEALAYLLRNKDADNVHRSDADSEYKFYGAVRATAACMKCHQHADKQVGDLLGMVEITFPAHQTEKKLAENNAILLATAIATAFLAMVAAYAIVRYVIVKPVLHLKDVSDQIARGNLDLRADIRTGDEFEELSHAFNRMLRHLVAVQEELRHVNGSLDAKVDELAQVNMRLFEMNNLKNDFLTTMSHELRTPLNSILGFSDVLAGSANINDKQKRYLHNIQSAGKDLLAMINDILDLAKIESGKMELHLADFSIDETIERLVGMLSPLAEKKNISLDFEVDPRLSVLRQDPGKLQQIIYNLLSNAIKFTPEGGRVRIAATATDDGQLELTVDDTGVGIPLEDQETIFEKFRQGNTAPGANNALTREFAGTGLGLSIVKELSKLLGGEVALLSELGKGSTFTVTVPTHLADQPDQLDESRAQQAIDLTNLRRVDYGLLEIAGKEAGVEPERT